MVFTGMMANTELSAYDSGSEDYGRYTPNQRTLIYKSLWEALGDGKVGGSEDTALFKEDRLDKCSFRLVRYGSDGDDFGVFVTPFFYPHRVLPENVECYDLLSVDLHGDASGLQEILIKAANEDLEGRLVDMGVRGLRDRSTSGNSALLDRDFYLFDAFLSYIAQAYGIQVPASDD